MVHKFTATRRDALYSKFTVAGLALFASIEFAYFLFSDPPFFYMPSVDGFGGTAIGRDFLNTWMGGRSALAEGPSAWFDFRVYNDFLRELIGVKESYFWSYPPHILLFIWPLLLAFILWPVLGLALFLYVVRISFLLPFLRLSLLTLPDTIDHALCRNGVAVAANPWVNNCKMDRALREELAACGQRNCAGADVARRDVMCDVHDGGARGNAQDDAPHRADKPVLRRLAIPPPRALD